MIGLIINGSSIQINLEDVSAVLANAKEEERQAFEVSPSGHGIHWPLIDEDISIDGLFNIPNTSPVQLEKAHNTGIKSADCCRRWRCCFVVGEGIPPGDGVMCQMAMS